MNEDTKLEIVRRIDYIENLLPQSGIMPDAKTKIEEHLRWIKDQAGAKDAPKQHVLRAAHENPRAELD